MATIPPIPQRDRILVAVDALAVEVRALAEKQKEHGEWMRRADEARTMAAAKARNAREWAMYAGAMAGAMVFDHAVELAQAALRWAGVFVGGG